MPLKMIGVNIDDNRPGGSKNFAEFSISDVKYIKVYRAMNKSYHIPLYHTSHGTYAPLLTLRDLTAALKPRGFKSYDNTILVNEARVKDVIECDEVVRIIFDDETDVQIAKKSRKRGTSSES